MILDSLNNLRQYARLFPGVDAAADFLEQLTEQTPSGHYPIDEQNIYAVVQRYETQTEDALLWECHNRYLDIQYIFSGRETILWAERRNADSWEHYNEDSDSAVAASCCPAVPLRLSAGQFVIFAPQDAHKPKCVHGEKSDVLKVVVKVRCV